MSAEPRSLAPVERARRAYASFAGRVMASMSELECQDIRAFDAWFYRGGGWRFALGIAAVVTAIAAVVAQLNVGLGLVEAALVFNFIAFLLLWAGLTAWFGHRRFQGKLLRTVLVTVVLVLAGAAVGATLTDFARGRDPLAWFHNSATFRHIVLAVLVFAFLYIAIIASIATLRNREYVARAARLEAEARQSALDRQLAESRLRLMQQQIEPHFLFNTLGSAQQLAEKGAPEAARLIGDLIRFLRTATPSLRENAATLADEAAQAAAYLAIMQTRLRARLAYTVDVPPALAARTIPPGMVITLVENAIKHGIEPLPAGGAIALTAREAERAGARVLEITVADTGAGLGPGLGAGVPGQGIGLANVRERLALIYGGRAALELAENAPHGFVARLVLPDDGTNAIAAGGPRIAAMSTTVPWNDRPH